MQCPRAIPIKQDASSRQQTIDLRSKQPTRPVQVAAPLGRQRAGDRINLWLRERLRRLNCAERFGVYWA